MFENCIDFNSHFTYALLLWEPVTNKPSGDPRCVLFVFGRTSEL